MGFKSIALVTTALVLSTNVNASVFNTLNGVDYEWLEFSETEGMTRTHVEGLFNDNTSALYGYTYASRSLTADLLGSYMTWDGLTGMHADDQVVDGMWQMLSDFGANNTYVSTSTTTSVDTNESLFRSGGLYTFFLYGNPNECSGITCFGLVEVLTNYGTPVLTYQDERRGFDPLNPSPLLESNTSNPGYYSSLLVKEVNPVPVPAAVWLFGSGLIGLIGFARRKA